MKKLLLIAFTFSILFSFCTQPEEPVVEAVQIVELLEFTSDGNESFSTDAPEMHFDSAQHATFLKFDNPDLRVRVNFIGQDIGVYEGRMANVYKWGINPNGSYTYDLLCDTNTGIVINVTKYGAVGESIEGTFSATNCDGFSDSKQIQSSFIVERTE